MKRLLAVLSIFSIVALSLVHVDFAHAFDGGDGTPGDPYQISTCAQLQSVGNAGNLDKSYVLTQDIDCSSFGSWGSGIGSIVTPFTGTMDGAGFAVLGLQMTSYNSYVGLFAYTNGATIHDIGIVDGAFHTSLPAFGSLVGYAVNTDISKSYASGSWDDNAPVSFHISRLSGDGFHEAYVQGFIPRFMTRQFPFSGVHDTLTLQIEQKGVTPFAGVDGVALDACGTRVPLTSAFYPGTGQDVTDDIDAVDLNVIGAHERPIRVSWNIPAGCDQATLSLTANEYGRGVPFKYPHSGAVEYALDSHPGSLTVDGIIAESDGSTPLFTPYWEPSTGHPSGNVPVYVSNDDDYLYVAADVTIDNTDDIGQDWIQVTVGSKVFRVSDDDATYGRCAFGLTSKVSYKHNTCELRIPRNELPSDGTVPLVLEYYGTASTTYFGGLVGYLANGSSIDQSYAYTDGRVNGATNARAGGLVGTSETLTSITDSYARGTLLHNGFGGNQAGLVAESNGTITHTYAAVALTGAGAVTVGGLTGSSFQAAVSSYWDTEFSGKATSSTGTGKTTAEMHQQNTFAGWDFVVTWDIDPTINDNYPFFRTEPEPPTPTPTPTPGGGGGGGGSSSYNYFQWIAQQQATPTPTPTPPPGLPGGLTEGDLIRADGDIDVFIVNANRYKRLFLNPIIFNFYGHLGGWDAVKAVSVATRDAYGTSDLLRDCESNAQAVYMLEITGGDTGVLHHVALSGDEAASQDPEFFKKVFCINDREYNWYPQGAPITVLSQPPAYSR